MSSFLQKTKTWLVGEAPQLADPHEIHISQVGDEVYNVSASNATANCGPVAVIMAMRMVHAPVPGANRYRAEALVQHIRQLATRDTNIHTGTHNLHLQRVLEMAGCSSRTLRNVDDMLKAVRDGEPVIMAGNPTAPGAYTQRFDYFEIRRWDSGHWILVSRWNPEAKTYTVNDPQSVIGPVDVTAAELRAFSAKDGNFGIAVRRNHR
jgi:hypothetical protein